MTMLVKSSVVLLKSRLASRSWCAAPWAAFAFAKAIAASFPEVSRALRSASSLACSSVHDRRFPSASSYLVFAIVYSSSTRRMSDSASRLALAWRRWH